MHMQYGPAHGRAQELTPGSAVEFWWESVRKNQPKPFFSGLDILPQGGGGGLPACLF